MTKDKKENKWIVELEYEKTDNAQARLLKIFEYLLSTYLAEKIEENTQK